MHEQQNKNQSLTNAQAYSETNYYAPNNINNVQNYGNLNLPSLQEVKC